MKPRILIIRFSSIGDIVQALSAAHALREKFVDSEIHWLVRSDLADLLRLSAVVDKVWLFDRATGLRGLLALARTLRKQSYDYLYDAHGSLRSRIVCFFLKSKNFIRRPKYRWKRFLQFQLRVKVVPPSSTGQSTYLEPLRPWGVAVGPSSLPPARVTADEAKAIRSQFKVPESYIALVPSAAWPKKRWPIEHWKEIIQKLSHFQLVLLGGREDLFISELYGSNTHVLNLAGRLTLWESCLVIAGAQSVISADTGLLHIADQLGVPAIALIGPTAFGYPGRPTSHVLEVHLPCKPCSKDGRGLCRNAIFQKCMRDITPSQVKLTLEKTIQRNI